MSHKSNKKRMPGRSNIKKKKKALKRSPYIEKKNAENAVPDTRKNTETCLNAYEAEQKKIQQNFSTVREALLETNKRIRLLEDSINEATVKKIYDQISILFNLIDDTKKSTLEKSIEKKDRELEDAADNMDHFLDMISEFLADFGIKSIDTKQGEPFKPKYHETSPGIQCPFPRSATVKRSLRRGFICGEQVLQKERVEI